VTRRPRQAPRAVRCMRLLTLNRPANGKAAFTGLGSEADNRVSQHLTLPGARAERWNKFYVRGLCGRREGGKPWTSRRRSSNST
jgi:hypothetical protein